LRADETTCIGASERESAAIFSRERIVVLGHALAPSRTVTTQPTANESFRLDGQAAVPARKRDEWMDAGYFLQSRPKYNAITASLTRLKYYETLFSSVLEAQCCA